MNTSREETKRINLWVHQEMINLIHELAEKHIPTPSKTSLYAYILKIGLDAWDDGKRVAHPKEFAFEGELNKFQYYIKETLIQRFNIAFDMEEPQPQRQKFFFHILCLGIEAYRREYDEFGIKRN